MWKLSVLTVVGLAFACAGKRSEPSREQPAQEKHTMPHKPPADATSTTKGSTQCVDSIRALATGDLSLWRGLHRCARADAESVLLTGNVPSPKGALTSSGTAYNYPATSGAPLGITITYGDGDIIYLIEVKTPKLGAKVEASLGTPEKIVPSGLRRRGEQWIYASKGLIVHKHFDELITIFAVRPTTVADFLKTPLSNVSVERKRRR